MAEINWDEYRGGSVEQSLLETKLGRSGRIRQELAEAMKETPGRLSTRRNLEQRVAKENEAAKCLLLHLASLRPYGPGKGGAEPEENVELDTVQF